MQGLQHLLRQPAVDQQNSIDSWHSANQSFIYQNQINERASSMGNDDSATDIKASSWNKGLLVEFQFLTISDNICLIDHVLDELQNKSKKKSPMTSSPQPVPIVSVKSPSQEFSSLGSSSHSATTRWKRSSPDPNKMMMMGRSPNVIDNNAKRILSTTPGRKSINVERVGSPCLSGYVVRRQAFLNENMNDVCFFKGARRSSLDGYSGCSSPPERAVNGFFPHDLDDIYEYKTDHQYFTHTGAYEDSHHDKFSISTEAQRNSLFRNHQMIHSMDEYGPHHRCNDIDFRFQPRNRFDNSSFIRSLNSSVSQTSVDSGTNTGGSSASSANSKERLSSKNHHHSSIHEIIKHFGKKVHIWPRNRHDSIVETSIVTSNTRNLTTPEPEEAVNFRSRSKSLDVTMTRQKIELDDCESTYKIYNRILKEGKRRWQ